MRKSSTTNDESAWGEWTSWCNERQVNPFQEPVNYIINFLSKKIDKGLRYRTVMNCSRLLFQHIMLKLMVLLWESIQKFVLYWQVYLIKDLHNQICFYTGCGDSFAVY